MKSFGRQNELCKEPNGAGLNLMQLVLQNLTCNLILNQNLGPTRLPKERGSGIVF